MKILTTILLAGAVLFLYGFNSSNDAFSKKSNIPFKNSGDDKPHSNPELIQKYFSDWHVQYGPMLPAEKMDEIWVEINAMPSESNLEQAVNSWMNIGPNFMNVLGGTTRYTGRILDIESDAQVTLRIASASGGLWETNNGQNVCISNNLTSLVIGSFDTKPGDVNTIIVGTGETYVKSGTGIFMTSNRGTTWSELTLVPKPQTVFKVRYEPGNVNNVHIAANTGYYKSTDGGVSWTRTFSSVMVPDFEFNPANPNQIYAGVWGDGIYTSTNGGNNWTEITSPGLPSSNIGRSDISIHSANPNIIYIGIAKNDNNGTLGTYKTTNGGTSWTTVTPDPSYLGNQGWYDNIITVSPTDPNLVFAGGIMLWGSTNGGSSWTELETDDIHADQHCALWSSDGSSITIGNDGGLTVSTDGGDTWNTSINNFPITQYVNIGVGVSNKNVLYGGSQDNGMSRTTNGGINWTQVQSGDGGGVAIDPFNANTVYVTQGVYGGNWAFRRAKTTNGGLNWTLIDNGVDPSTQWYNKIRTDLVNPYNLYNNASNYVYVSTNNGTAWTKLNPVAFPDNIGNLNVSKFQTPAPVVYASLSPTGNPPFTGRLLRVYDNGVWSERSEGFPNNTTVKGVSPHPVDINKGYAYMAGFIAGQKVFKTTNRGVNWINISGNLPNVPMGDIVPHPTDDSKLYAGTEFGCYRTTDGGMQWHRWNSGMPDANIISEFVTIDSIAQNGRYYIVAGSYGRSMWIREISGDDPIGITNNGTAVPSNFNLKQNYPNPFNPATVINFDLPKSGLVTLKIYDINGKEVANLVNSNLAAGSYKVDFNASHLTSGIYFYRISAGSFTDSKKMMLIK